MIHTQKGLNKSRHKDKSKCKPKGLLRNIMRKKEKIKYKFHLQLTEQTTGTSFPKIEKNLEEIKLSRKKYTKKI